MKKCSKCKIELSTDKFWKNKSAKDGFQFQCKDCQKISNGSGSQVRIRVDAVMKLGGLCSGCGFSDIRALQIDHINGGGSQEFKNTHNITVYRKIRNGDTDGYQVLCANCNWIKRSEENENGDYFTDRI